MRCSTLSLSAPFGLLILSHHQAVNTCIAATKCSCAGVHRPQLRVVLRAAVYVPRLCQETRHILIPSYPILLCGTLLHA